MSEAEKEPDNIIEFKAPKADELPIERKQRTYTEHVHGRFEIDERNRQVLCRRCNKYIDPFVALLCLTDQMADVRYKWGLIQEYEKKERAKYDKRMLKNIEKGGAML